VFIGFVSVVILIVGLFLGFFLASNLEEIDLQIINIGITFTNIILLLIIGGLVVEIKYMLLNKPGKNK